MGAKLIPIETSVVFRCSLEKFLWRLSMCDWEYEQNQKHRKPHRPPAKAQRIDLKKCQAVSFASRLYLHLQRNWSG